MRNYVLGFWSCIVAFILIDDLITRLNTLERDSVTNARYSLMQARRMDRLREDAETHFRITRDDIYELRGRIASLEDTVKPVDFDDVEIVSAERESPANA